MSLTEQLNEEANVSIVVDEEMEMGSEKGHDFVTDTPTFLGWVGSLPPQQNSGIPARTIVAFKTDRGLANTNPELISLFQSKGHELVQQGRSYKVGIDLSENVHRVAVCAGLYGVVNGRIYWNAFSLVVLPNTGPGPDWVPAVYGQRGERMSNPCSLATSNGTVYARLRFWVDGQTPAIYFRFENA